MWELLGVFFVVVLLAGSVRAYNVNQELEYKLKAREEVIEVKSEVVSNYQHTLQRFDNKLNSHRKYLKFVYDKVLDEDQQREIRAYVGEETAKDLFDYPVGEQWY